MRRGGRVRRRHDQAVRLYALVDLGDVAAHHESGGRGPRRLSGGQLGGALLALLEQDFGRGDLGGLEEFVVLEGVADGLVIDQYVGQERAALKFIDGCAQVRQPGLKFGAIGGRDFDPGRGDRLDGWLGKCRNRKQECARQRLHNGSHYPTAWRTP